MPKKQSSSTLSTLASKVLSGEKKPTITESKKLAASCPLSGREEGPAQVNPARAGKCPRLSC